MIKVKDASGNELKGMLRNNNGALVSVDLMEYQSYKQKKQQVLDQETRIKKIESSIDDIKSLLNQLINK